MAAGTTASCQECELPSVQCVQRACEVERQQRARAIARLESTAGDDLTDDQRAVVAELARSLTTTLTPVVIETTCRTRGADDEQPRAGPPDRSEG